MDLHNLESLKERSRSIKSKTISNVFSAIMLRDKESIVLFVKERWKRGLRPSGAIIGEYQSFAYEMEKRSRNPLADGKVDLFDTGALSEGLTVFSGINSNFTIFSKDEKAIEIAQKYGLDVYGLTKEETEIVLSLVSSKTNIALMNYLFNKVTLPV